MLEIRQSQYHESSGVREVIAGQTQDRVQRIRRDAAIRQTKTKTKANTLWALRVGYGLVTETD